MLFQSTLHGFCDLKFENVEVGALFLKISRTKIFMLRVWFWCGSILFVGRKQMLSPWAFILFPVFPHMSFRAYLQHREIVVLFILSKSLSLCFLVVPFPVALISFSSYLLCFPGNYTPYTSLFWTLLSSSGSNTATQNVYFNLHSAVCSVHNHCLYSTLCAHELQLALCYWARDFDRHRSC